MNTIPALVQIMAWYLQGADKKKTQCSALLAIMRGMDQWPVNSLHKGPVTRKMFPFDDVIMTITPISSGNLCITSLTKCINIASFWTCVIRVAVPIRYCNTEYRGLKWFWYNLVVIDYIYFHSWCRWLLLNNEWPAYWKPLVPLPDYSNHSFHHDINTVDNPVLTLSESVNRSTPLCAGHVLYLVYYSIDSSGPFY